MLPVNNAGHNNYNTSFGCKGNVREKVAKKILNSKFATNMSILPSIKTAIFDKKEANKLAKQMRKSNQIFKQNVLDQLTLTDPVANATQKLRAGSISEAEHRTVLMRSVFGDKMTLGDIIKSIFKK